MPRITAIEPQKRKKDWYNIFVDGKYLFSLSTSALVSSHLKVNQELSEVALDNFIIQSETEKLYEKALYFLSVRPRSEFEVRRRLKEKTFRNSYFKANPLEPIIDSVINKLNVAGYLNDEAFARWWIEERNRSRPRGKQLLKSELFQKRVPREIIDAVLSDDSLGVDESSAALRLAEKRLPKFKNLPLIDQRKKLSEYLARRGFSWDIIRDVINQLTAPST